MTSNCFYYGVYSPQGYYSLATKPTFKANKNFAVKSYHPSAKHKFFETVKAEFENRGYGYISFNADGRTDGFYSKDAGLRIIDGTDCNFDEADFQIITLDNICTSEMQNMIRIRNEAQARAVRFLSACRCISDDMVRLESSNTDIVKANRFSTRLWSQTGGTLKGTVGTEYKRFVTCITSDGVEINTEAFCKYCDKVTVIVDRTGTCARYITDRVRRYALSAGYDVISCLCPIHTDRSAEHIIIPELRYGIFVDKHHHKAELHNVKKTFAARFITDSTENKKRLDFSFKAYKSLMQEVFSSLETVEYCDSELDKMMYTDNEKAEKYIQFMFDS